MREKIKKILKRSRMIMKFIYYINYKYSNYFVHIKEFKRFKKQYSSLFSRYKFKNIKEKNALILCNHENYYSIKIELIFSLILKHKGYNIYFLCDKYYWINKYIKWTKLGSIIYLDKYYNRESNFQNLNFFDLDYNIANITKMRYKDVWIGPQILSSIFRRLKAAGNINLNENETKIQIKEIIKNSIDYVEIGKKICREKRFDLCILNEPNYEINSALTDTFISNNIDVVQYLQPSKDDALTLRRLNRLTRREHPSSLSKQNFNFLINRNWSNKHELDLKKEFNSRYDGTHYLQARNQYSSNQDDYNTTKKLLGISKNSKKKIACIFSPVLWDANLFYGEDLFDDFGDWLKQTLIAAKENKNVIWLVKLHPANLWKMQRDGNKGKSADYKIINKLFSEIPTNIKILSPDTMINNLNLFKVIDYGITVRGTVGIELPCFGVPLLTAGTGRYSNFGFTIDSSTKKEYLDKLSNIQKIPLMNTNQIKLAKWYAYGALILRPWYMKSFKTVFHKTKYKNNQNYDIDFVPVSSSLEKLFLSEDIIKLDNWFSSVNVDYLN